MVTLIGMGAGLPGSLTAEGLAALQQADLILGARRLLEHLPDGCTEHRKALYKPEEILTCLAEHPEGDTALLYSGDTGFYSSPASSCSRRRSAAPGRTGNSSPPTAVPATRWPSA